MKSEKKYMTFTADFPDTWKFGDDGEVAMPGGKEIAEKISSLLADKNLETSLPEQHEFYGWAFTATSGKYEYWMLLQEPQEWLLIIEQKGSFLNFTKNSQTSFQQFLSIVADILNTHGNFDNVKVYTKSEYESRK